MTYPKFAIGEDVIAYTSTGAQGVNAIVTGREYRAHGKSAVTGKVHGPGYRYFLDVKIDGVEYAWLESCLRKRPADLTFHEIMDFLTVEENQ